MKFTILISQFILVFLLQINLGFDFSSLLLFSPSRFSPIDELPGSLKVPLAPANKFALLIGIKTYPNLPEEEQLVAPENDVALLKDLLVKNYGFTDDPSRIKPLLSKDATRKNIIDAFENFLIKNPEINKESVVVFYYSGHGSWTEDKNEDEGDGKDETIVPVDRGKNGITDILDDDISEWIEQLRQKTPNITIIFDSCNSGTGTKSMDSRLKVKHVPPDTQPQPEQKKLPENAKKSATKDIGNGILARSESYVSISSCLPDQESEEDKFETSTGGRWNSVMTHYLVQALKRKSDLTYRKLGEVLLNETDRKFTQQAQVEGAIGRKVFGGSAMSEDPFIPLKGASNGKILKLKAGAVHGLQIGTLVAVYKPEMEKLVGETGKLSNAILIVVEASESTAEMPADTAVPADAKVSIITPNFGNKRLRVALDESGSLVSNEEGIVTRINEQPEKNFVKNIASIYKSGAFSKLVEVVPVGSTDKPLPSGTWDVVLVRGFFGKIKNFLTLDNPPAIRDSQNVYYLAVRDSNLPLFDIWVTAADMDGAQRLTNALGKKAQQDNLKRLVNVVSPLDELIKVTVIRSKVETAANGKKNIIDETRADDQLGTPVFGLGEFFKLKFENLSNKELYVTLISLGTSGAINVISSERKGTKIAGRESFIPGLHRIKSPKGIQTFKIIITTSETDFSFLEQPGAKDIKEFSAFDFLLDRANTGQSKDPNKESGLGLDSWGTAQINFKIK